MAGDRNKKSRTRRVSTDWGPWVYDTNRRCYVTSRINSRGEDEFEYSGKCDPAESTTDGLEAGINQISFSPDETESEGIEVVAQGGRMLPSSSGNETSSFQVSTSPGSYGTSAGLASYSQGQGGRYMSLPGTTGLEAQEYGSNSSVHTQSNYTASYGSEQGTDYGGSQLGSTTPLSSVDMPQPDVLGGYNGSSWNNTPQYSTSYNSPRPVMKPDNSSFKDQIQTGLVANSQHKQGGHGKLSKVAHSVLDVRHTRTDYLPKIPLWKGKLLTLYTRRALLTLTRVQNKHLQGVQAGIFVWTEPDGKGNGRSRGKPSNLSYVSDAKYGELAYTSIRRFAIFKTRPGFSLCL
ncbi:hypothetical protein V496_04397 [Pseudogymnoascus sp. VKM F-4515 (FW-2607)]|nr:hypothetical protein V496_04397 [Pseudogymnoascus sp. VKM F-4515 (FW-2607)]